MDLSEMRSKMRKIGMPSSQIPMCRKHMGIFVEK